MSLPILFVLFPVLLIGVLQWLMPSLTAPTVQFGVRIPAERENAPVIAEQRRRFRIATVLVTVAAALVTPFAAGRPFTLGPLVTAQLVASTALYLRARAAISVAKRREDWFRGLRQVTVADTTLRAAPERFPWRWTIPSVLLLAGTAVTGLVRYPAMPARLATHFDTNGRPDHFAGKSIGSAFGLLLVQVCVTLLLCGLAALALRSKTQLDAEDPNTGTKHRRYVSAMSRGLLVLSLCVNVTLLVGSLQTWNLIKPTGPMELALMGAPMLLGTLVLVGAAIRTGQGGSRLTPAAGPAPSTRATTVNRDDDRLYRWGLVYYNPDDPAVFVPKRFGVGWTVNMARPAAWIFLAATFALVAALALISLI